MAFADEPPFVKAGFFLWKELGQSYTSSHGSQYFGEEDHPLRLSDHDDAYGNSLVSIVLGSGQDSDFDLAEDADEVEVKRIVDAALKLYREKLAELAEEDEDDDW